MMDSEKILHLLRHSLPDAQIAVEVLPGKAGQFSIHVISAGFIDKGRVERRQAVYDALRGPIDFDVRNVTLSTSTPDGCTSREKSV